MFFLQPKEKCFLLTSPFIEPRHPASIVVLSYNWRVLTDEDKQWIKEQLEKVETTLPTEFHKWASPVEMRQPSHAAALRALDAEVDSLSDR